MAGLIVGAGPVGLTMAARWAPDDYAGTPRGSGNTPKFIFYGSDKVAGNALAHRYPAIHEAETRAAQDPAEIFLVRPDGYLGLSTSHTNWDAAERYVRTVSA